MTPEELYATLKKLQEPKGYFFNKDEKHVFGLLEGLLKNRERYGYMGCPCRLACGDRKKDADIICPCAYRDKDILEYGACFCALYVSEDLNEGRVEAVTVPERRPEEKVLAALLG